MAQIVPRAPGIAESIGTGLGSGIGNTLNGLANLKLQQFAQKAEQQQVYSTLRQNPLISDQGAQFLSTLDPQSRQAFLSNMEFPSNFFYQQQGAQPQQQQSGVQELQNMQQQQPQMQQQAGLQQTLQGLSNPLEAAKLLAQTGLGNAPQGQAPVQQMQPQQGAQMTPQVNTSAAPDAQQQQMIKPFEKPEERRHRQLMDIKERSLLSKERADAFKATKEERKEILTSARNAKRDLQDLDRLEELEKEGKLDTPGYIELLKRSGLDIPALMNPGSEEYQKITANFMRGIKDYTRGNITNFELESFLKTIPSLSQSPEGRKRVMANLKRLKRTELLYKDAYKEVLSQNKGIPPLDLSEQIDDVIEPKIELLSEQFKKDLAKPVPKGQNKLITALQAGLGGAVHNLPKAASGAILGGLAGGLPSVGIGAIPGAIAGGLAGLSGLSIRDII